MVINSAVYHSPLQILVAISLLVSIQLLQSVTYFTYYLCTGFDDPDLQHLLGADAVQLQRSRALFLLKMKEVHKLPQTALNDVVEGFKTVFT